MMAAVQPFLSGAISKTINMPSSATHEDCAEALLMAWSLKLKGITIYRTGSREDVVLALKETTPAPVAGRNVPEKIPTLSINRPRELQGRTYLCQ